MASSSKKKEIRNQRARIRYVAMSVQDREKLNSRQRENYARRARSNINEPSDLARARTLNDSSAMANSNGQIHDGEDAFGVIQPIACLPTGSQRIPQIYTSSTAFQEQPFLHVQAQNVPENVQQNCNNIRRVANRFKRMSDIAKIPWILPITPPCSYCGAFRFSREVVGFCCSKGQISLVDPTVCPILHSSFTGQSEVACQFRRRSRTYNNAFAFTSMGIKTDPQSWWAKDGIYALKVIGQVCHFMNPIDGSPNTKDMLQLFFLDTSEDLDPQVLQSKQLRVDIMELLIAALSKNPYSIFFKRLQTWNDL
ncbi:hypothetical protein ABFS83_07G078300 [Erythranthe nasuta]